MQFIKVVKSKIRYQFLIGCILFTQQSYSQKLLTDSSRMVSEERVLFTLKENEQAYPVNKGRTFIYKKPKKFGFITKLPTDAAGIIKTTFKKESVKPLLYIGGSTLLLLLVDQPVSDGLKKFSENIHFHNEAVYKDVINLKMGNNNISIFKAPQNLNTALYQMGQGFPSLLLGAGLFTYGKIKKDYRALSTSSQLAEAFILMGLNTQVLKRISGRQSPSNSTGKGGEWHFLPSFKKYQNNTPNYDAFPSGHLATMMSTVTIMAENYPEKKYIKPLGYSLIGLVGASMINNDAHWISDYPLAIALGYLCAKQVAKRSRKVIDPISSKNQKSELSYSLNFINGRLMPGLIYKF